MRISDWSSDVCSSDLQQNEQDHVLTHSYALRPRDISPWRVQPGADLCSSGVTRARQPASRCLPSARRVSPTSTRRGRLAGFLHRCPRSEEHTSELQSLMRISYAVFCLQNKNTKPRQRTTTQQ